MRVPTIVLGWASIFVMGLELPLAKARDYAKDNAHDVIDPIVYTGTAVKAWLDEFNHYVKVADINNFIATVWDWWLLV